MISLAKGLLAVTLGVGGMGGIVYGVSKSSSNTKREGISVSEPILVCGDGYSKSRWNIFLKQAEENENDLGDRITFRVWWAEGEKSKNIPWGSKAKGTNDWTNWRLNFKDKEVNELWFKEGDAKAYHVTYLLSKCESSKIELINPVQNQDENGGIEATNIKFKVDRKNCKDPVYGGCNIQFESGTNLKWKDNFQPKIFYTTAQ